VSPSHHTITQVEALKRPRGHCAVYVDGEPALKAHRESVLAAGLRPGQELGKEELENALRVVQEADALRQAFDYLGGRDRTETELRRRLGSRKFPQPIIATVLDRLRKQGLIDDRRYARECVRTQSARRGLGPRALYGKLVQRGVASSLVEEALVEELPDAEQESIAETLARTRLSRLRGASREEARPRLYQFILRRGFDPDIAARAIDRVLGDRED